jgi:hypothetical protein
MTRLPWRLLPVLALFIAWAAGAFKGKPRDTNSESAPKAAK